MSLRNAKKSLDMAAKELEARRDAREYLIRNTRGVISLCSRAIIDMHRGDAASAKDGARRAAKLLASHKKRAAGLMHHLTVPEQELVEALSFIAISEGRPVPSMRALHASPQSYVLGLLDCIGELKRLVLDMIRAGRPDEARRIFDAAEELYEYLYPFAAYDKVVPEARRKLDVGRSLVEGMRAIITEETRRAAMIEAAGRISRV